MKSYIFSLFIAVVFIFSSCTERIDISTNIGYAGPIIYGKITTDTTKHTVKITRSIGYFENTQPTPISNVQVFIHEYDSDQKTLLHTYILNENPELKGEYETEPDVYGKLGMYYQLEANFDFNGDGVLEKYQSTFSRINNPIKIHAVAVTNNYLNDDFSEDIYVVLAVAYQDIKTQDNNYLCKVHINDTLISSNIRRQQNIFTDHQFGIPTGTLCYLLSQTERRPEQHLEPGDVVTLEIDNITKQYVDFLTAANSEIAGSVPMFSGPPANIPSNINNKAIGHFTAYAISKAKAIVVNSKSTDN